MKNNQIALLDRAYSNPRKWSFIFQRLAMTTILQNHIHNATTKIMERSLGSTHHVFLRAYHNKKIMNHQATKVLQQWYHTANEIHATTSDLIIYLRAPPAVAMKRLQKRGRKEERHISSEYLHVMNTLYEK